MLSNSPCIREVLFLANLPKNIEETLGDDRVIRKLTWVFKNLILTFGTTFSKSDTH